MKSLIIFAVVCVSASLAAPSGVYSLNGLNGLGGLGLGGLGYGGLGCGGLGCGGLGYGGHGYGGHGYGVTTLVAAAPAYSVQKTIVANPGVIATGPAWGHGATIVAAPAIAAPAAATSAVVHGPSGLITSKQVNPGGVAVVGHGGWGWGGH